MSALTARRRGSHRRQALFGAVLGAAIVAVLFGIFLIGVAVVPNWIWG